MSAERFRCSASSPYAASVGGRSRTCSWPPRRKGQLDVAVLHYDADFDAIAQVTGQPCRWVVPAGSVQ